MKITLRLLLLISFTAFLTSCSSEPDEIDTGSDEYREAVSNFYVSLGAGDTEEARFAFNKMNDVANAFPEEPAAWANLGVFAMRQGNLTLADERFEQARELAPNHPDVLYLSGLLESRKGNIEATVNFMRSAVEADPTNTIALYSLIEELERQDEEENREEILDRVRQLKNILPDNRAVWFEVARIAGNYEEVELLDEAMNALAEYRSEWRNEAVEQFEVVQEIVADGDYGELNLELAFLRNAVEPGSAFLEDLREIQRDPNEVGFLIERFINLPMPDLRASEPDLDITFSDLQDSELPQQAQFVKSATLLEDLPPLPLYIMDSGLHIDDSTILSFPGSSEERIPPHAMTEIDYNYNFMNDIALAGSDGFRLYEQNEDQSFTDITASLNLSDRILNGNYYGVWTADIDLDGDLDLVLAPVEGEPIALRNNTDDTFTEVDLFTGVENVVDFRWADLDNDGAADGLMLTRGGELAHFKNLRNGVIEKSDRLPVDETVDAFAVADLNANGTFDIVTLTADGEVQRLEYKRSRDSWDTEILFDVEPGNRSPETTRIFAPDLDNNGSLDLVLTSDERTDVWLSDSDLNFTNINVDLPGGVYSIFDIDGNDRLDLLGLADGNSTYQKMNSGTKGYNARSIRARASGAEGDQRINSFGIGGEMEIRTQLLYQKQSITSPIVHFGLGNHDEAEMLRIIWPNGSVQAEFAELGMGATIFNEQILKGSCPWLFTNDGEEMHFITDILWRSPLGLRINAQETAGVIQTLDRVRIPGEQLNPVDGVYDLRITAELWETHFFDYVSLVAVDHPEDSEIFVDERFVFPAPDLSTRAVTTPKPVKAVYDQQGNDVTDTVRGLDQNYLKPFEKTSYQGLVEEHYIEIELGEDAPADQPIWLIASGWLRPTDSSINLALSQGEHEPPTGLRVEVSDGEGGWNELHEEYGVPAGKTKSILLELDDVFADSSDRRVRLHTTSEIYWDAIQWGVNVSTEQITEQELTATKMDLRYRGYSEWDRKDEVSPKLPDYDVISSTNQRWRDLIGYHTRFGDVTELLSEIDDRYVIMNAGDEILLEFEAVDEPAPGYKRSYVFVSDGWVKDGDYNTAASKTVTPLPYHGKTDYEYGTDSDLWNDPVFKEHREDWIHYHTRFVTPESFRTALSFEK